MTASATGGGSLAEPVPVSGDSGASSGGGAASEEKPKARKIEQPEPEPLDLGEMSQDAIMKRAKPVLIGVGALLAVFLIFRGLRGKKD